MSADENKALARRIHELLDTRNMEALKEIADPMLVNHTPRPGQASGVAGVLDVVRTWFHAFPDVGQRIEEQIAEGDKVVTRYTWWGTHRGEMVGIAPTGRRVRVSGIEIHRVNEGKVTDIWRIEDSLSLMQQLGVVPEIGRGEIGGS